MTHIKYDKQTRAEVTPVEWLNVGAQIGQLANIWANRGDLIGYVGPGAGGLAPACYTPATAEVEVNVDVAFGKGTIPADIGDIRIRENQFLWPKATGAVFHEALHARFSNWNIGQASQDLTPQEFRALLFLEESRIEAHGTDIMPENAGFLRACALEIVLADLQEEPLSNSDTHAAAALAALTLARVDAGSLEHEDVEGLSAAIEDKLGADTLAKLRELWLAVQNHDNHSDATSLYDISREWVRVVSAQAEANGDVPEEQGQEGGGLSTPNPSGTGGESSEFMKDLIEALNEAASNATIGSFEQLEDQRTAEEWKDIAKDRAAESRETKENIDTAQDVFGKGTGPMADSKTRSRLVEKRKPSAAERIAAVKVATMLEKAKYRDRDETEISSIVPPGRLRTRALVQGAALKSKGIMTQAEPWRRTVRKQVDDPTLTIGVMVDISGSMAEAMEPMAVTAWVMSEAVRRVQGRTAMVYFGQDVFPTLKPGQHLDDVTVYTASDGTEKFNRAFKALDGSLNLLNGSGARLLVVVSDGCYTPEEVTHARRWIDRCARAGTGVLWLSMDDGRDARSLTRGTSVVLMTGTSNPEAVATDIGNAAARALSSAA
jgi:hypothetical protein